MDSILMLTASLLSGVGLGLMIRFLARWLKYHRQAVRLNNFAMTWKSEFKRLPEYQAMVRNRLLFFATFAGTLVVANGLVASLSLLQ